MARRGALALVVGVLAWGAAPEPASALNPIGAVCSAAGAISKVAAIPCAAAKHAGGLLGVGKRLITGGGGSAVSAAASVGAAFGLGALLASVLDGAKFALDETAKVLGATTSPNLRSTWFSGTYWRMAGIAAVLTLPFLFAAAVQALLRSDLALLARSVFLHLPLALLAVSIAAPLTMLVLSASDELSAIVSGATGHESTHFLSASGVAIGALNALSSPFLALLIGAFTVAGAVVLWIELLMRETAVYVIVLMLPLAFAAFVWPSRRIWAVRTLELLFALILAKFAIVAVLSLGGAALNTSLGTASVSNWLAGLVLVVMAAFMPWALLRLVPLTEVASAAAGSLRGGLHGLKGPAQAADMAARAGDDWLSSITAHMRRQARDVPASATTGSGGPADGGEAEADGGEAATDNSSEAVAEQGPPADGDSADSPAGAEADESAEAPEEDTPETGTSAPPAASPASGPPAASPGAAARGAGPAATSSTETADGAVAAAPEVADRIPRADVPPVQGTTPPSSEPDILRRPNMSVAVVLGSGDIEPANARARTRTNGDRATDPPASTNGDGATVPATADDPDPRPPTQDRPEGPL